MSLSSRSYVNRYTPSNRFPTGVKWLLIITVSLSVLNILLKGYFFAFLALVPSDVVRHFAIWELVTYLLVQGGITAILWNMLALWMFGAELERTWGTQRFLRFYFGCGIIGALAFLIGAYLFGGVNVPTVGAESAILGMLAAYAILFPDTTMLFGFLIPIKTKYFVMIIGAVILVQTYLATAGRQYGGMSILASLGGLLAGFVLVPKRGGRKVKTNVRQPLLASYKEWKLRRAKRKFEVYLRKRDSDRDRWVH
jgi:membrane associated rhomboid family serine protease